jgi:hypothetical protein
MPDKKNLPEEKRINSTLKNQNVDVRMNDNFHYRGTLYSIDSSKILLFDFVTKSLMLIPLAKIQTITKLNGEVKNHNP